MKSFLKKNKKKTNFIYDMIIYLFFHYISYLPIYLCLSMYLSIVYCHRVTDDVSGPIVQSETLLEMMVKKEI